MSFPPVFFRTVKDDGSYNYYPYYGKRVSEYIDNKEVIWTGWTFDDGETIYINNSNYAPAVYGRE